MATYMLRGIPNEDWDKFRERAAKDGIPLRQAFAKLIKEYAQRPKPTDVIEKQTTADPANG